MRMCYITDAAMPFSVGGSEKRLFEIAKRMAAKGYDVNIVCAAPKEYSSLKGLSEVHDGITYHVVHIYNSLFTGGQRSVFQALHFSFGVFKHLAVNKYDYIECIQSPVVHIPVVWLMKGKAKFILSWFEVWNKDVSE